MIGGLTNAGAIPVLERTIQFSAQRHGILANNIANLSTPGFRPTDVSPDEFQKSLSSALEDQRSGRSGSDSLNMKSTRNIKVNDDSMTLAPQPAGDNILFHDGNDRDLDRTMQDLVENFMTFRAASQMMRKQFDSLNTAIAERV